MAHHGSEIPDGLKEMFPEKEFADFNMSEQLRERLRELQQPGLGATNRFPQGKLNEADEGEIQFALAADKTNGKVLINFGKPVAWVGMDKQQAIEFAELLRQKADELP